MSEIEDFLNLIGGSEEEALVALLSAFGPPQPGALHGAWKKSSHFGNSAPATKDIWRLFVDADFRCSQCGSQRRISLDHVDGNASNHELTNLRVLCFSCNRGKVGKRSTKAGDPTHALKLYRAALDLHRTTGSIPKDSAVARHAGVKGTSGATYLLKFLRKRLNAGPA